MILRYIYHILGNNEFLFMDYMSYYYQYIFDHIDLCVRIYEFLHSIAPVAFFEDEINVNDNKLAEFIILRKYLNNLFGTDIAESILSMIYH